MTSLYHYKINFHVIVSDVDCVVNIPEIRQLSGRYSGADNDKKERAVIIRQSIPRLKGKQRVFLAANA